MFLLVVSMIRGVSFSQEGEQVQETEPDSTGPEEDGGWSDSDGEPAAATKQNSNALVPVSSSPASGSGLPNGAARTSTVTGSAVRPLIQVFVCLLCKATSEVDRLGIMSVRHNLNSTVPLRAITLRP